LDIACQRSPPSKVKASEYCVDRVELVLRQLGFEGVRTKGVDLRGDARSLRLEKRRDSFGERIAFAQ
jgi:hypothetical protein